jgi:LuxR family maltose regulon positive regulatory protein
MLAQAEAGAYRERVFEFLRLQAFALNALGRTRAAQDSIWRALAIAASEGYIRSFVEEGSLMQELLSDACAELERNLRHGEWQERQGLLAYIKQLLAAFESPMVLVVSPSASLSESLTKRERDVLRLLVAGYANPQIAAALVVAPSTVHSHVKNIYAKLGVRNRIQAAERARSLGLV